jgi:hypothetical protein
VRSSCLAFDRAAMLLAICYANSLIVVHLANIIVPYYSLPSSIVVLHLSTNVCTQHHAHKDRANKYATAVMHSGPVGDFPINVG